MKLREWVGKRVRLDYPGHPDHDDTGDVVLVVRANGTHVQRALVRWDKDVAGYAPIAKLVLDGATVETTARLATVTQLGAWTHGESDEASCQECDWSVGPDKMRVVEYEARRHVVATRHVVDQSRCWTRPVFLADDVR